MLHPATSLMWYNRMDGPEDSQTEQTHAGFCQTWSSPELQLSVLHLCIATWESRDRPRNSLSLLPHVNLRDYWFCTFTFLHLFNRGPAGKGPHGTQLQLAQSQDATWTRNRHLLLEASELFESVTRGCDAEKTAICKPGREASEGTNPADTLISDFQPPEWQAVKVCVEFPRLSGLISHDGSAAVSVKGAPWEGSVGGPGS